VADSYRHGNDFSVSNERRVGQQLSAFQQGLFCMELGRFTLSLSCRATFVMFRQLHLLGDS
jgi:hypothetical protein